MSLLKRAYETLEELEFVWCDYDHIWHRSEGYYCNECGGHRDVGHRSSCELGKLLQEIQEELEK